MKSLTSQLVLDADTAIDLQMHTLFSDGTWVPEQLLDYLASEQFGLVAITDHDRVDTAALLQQLALERQLPLLTAVEMSTIWRDGPTDVLCFGFDPEQNALQALTESILDQQEEITRKVYANLRKKGWTSADPQELTVMLERPAAQQMHNLLALVEKHGLKAGGPSLEELMSDTGFEWVTNDIADVVEAAHQSGAVCLIAHPGRQEGYICYNEQLLDELRQEVPIDGFEVYHPRHTPEQVVAFQAYAQTHHLLTSSGSDSHGPQRKPIKYRAEWSRRLLERLGIQVR